MIKRLYGVNIAVQDLDAAVKQYSALLGGEPEWTKPEDFAFPGLSGATIWVQDVRINLIASENPETAISKFVDRNGPGVFLISFQTDDLVNDMPKFAEAGVKLVSPEPMAYSGGKVNFGHPKSLHGVQMEFIQPDNE